MIKLIFPLAILLGVGAFVGCSRVNVEPGTEVVLVSHPYLFGKGGVLDAPLTQGSEYVALSTHGESFVNTPLSYEEHFDNMVTADHIPIDFSSYINIQLLPGKSPVLYNKFGKRWYENNIKVYFRTLVRDKASRYKMFVLTSDREILTQVEKDIYTEILAYVTKIGLPVNVLHVTIGAVTPPAKVLAETENTAAQTQGVLTQEARAKTETARKGSEEAKAAADNAYRISMGMTMEEYLKLRSLEIEKEKIEMVRGKDNVTVIMGGAVPTYDAHK